MSTTVDVIVVENNMSNFCDLKGERGVDGLSIPGPPGSPGPPGPVINLQEVWTHRHKQKLLFQAIY